jgi:hypothetical protein
MKCPRIFVTPDGERDVDLALFLTGVTNSATTLFGRLRGEMPARGPKQTNGLAFDTLPILVLPSLANPTKAVRMPR